MLWFAGPLLIRLSVVPLGHFWDLQTWYNMFVDFHHGRTPYDTMQTLSFEARAEHTSLYHFYYAYPPGLIYLYWPISQLYALLDPGLHYSLGRQGSVVASAIPWYFNYFFDLPLIIADLGIAALLWKMAGPTLARRYAWSLYPVLVIIWMFEPLLALSILGGVYSLERGKSGWAALAFALGTVLKYVPVFLVIPTLLYLLRRGASPGTLVRFGLIYSLTCLVLVAPFWQGTLFCLEFHAARQGGGLNWHSIFYFLSEWRPDLLDDYGATAMSAAIGSLVLPIGLVAVYAYTYRADLSANRTILVSLLGYLAFTKIVNEVYLLNLIPLVLLELHRQPSRRKEFFYKLFWSIPIACALVSTPPFYFLTTWLQSQGQLDLAAVSKLASFTDLKIPSLVMAVAGTFFTGLCLAAIPLFGPRSAPKAAISGENETEEDSNRQALNGLTNITQTPGALVKSGS